jgi:hypothetical protein
MEIESVRISDIEESVIVGERYEPAIVTVGLERLRRNHPDVNFIAFKSGDSKDPLDFIIQADGKDFMYIEAKTRDFCSTKYPTTLVPLNKIDRAKKLGLPFGIIVYFKGDGMFYCFNGLKKEYPSRWITRSDRETGYDKSLCVDIPMEDALYKARML